MKSINELRSAARVACECEAVFGMWCKHEVEAVVAAAREESREPILAKPRDEWGEEDGPVLWWKFPVREAPYCGMELDDDFPDYVTHWTTLSVPVGPAPSEDDGSSPVEAIDFDRNACPGCGGGCQAACR